jgi:hypothetical protein
MPEQVACLVDGNWYAAGFRVRCISTGEEAATGRQLLFSPRVRKWTNESADQGERCLSSLFRLPLLPQSMLTMVIMSDSSCNETGFRYGLTCVLRNAGIFVLWMVCKGGAKAKDLTIAWTKAPHADIGLTIYNLNDFAD